MGIPARISIVTLGVADIRRSSAFYEALGWKKAAASQDVIRWFHTADSVLGLWSRDELAGDASVPSDGRGFDGVTLSINLESEAAVDDAMRTAEAAGARMTKRPHRVEWGGYSGYFADPDGHLWELAYNPFFAIGPDGRLHLE